MVKIFRFKTDVNILALLFFVKIGPHSVQVREPAIIEIIYVFLQIDKAVMDVRFACFQRFYGLLKSGN